MLIAHAPAGYLLSKAVTPARRMSPSLMLTGLFFAVAPDLDLFWFYLFSNRAVSHHRYITHWPLAWAAFFGLCLLLSFILRKPGPRPFIRVGFACVMLHLVLDSFAAEIYWLAPFYRFKFNLVRVPSPYGWWIWNHLLHWTFAVEIGICLIAALVFLLSRKAGRGNNGVSPL